MPISGNLTFRRKRKERGKKLKKKEDLWEILWLFLIGRRTQELSPNNKRKISLNKKSKCWLLSGKRKRSMKENLRDRSLYLIVRETSS
jgi:hypothetical protein